MKKKTAKTEIGLLLTRLRKVWDVKNPNQAERRAAYLKKVKLLIAKGRKS